jgi:hypothetical protein
MSEELQKHQAQIDNYLIAKRNGPVNSPEDAYWRGYALLAILKGEVPGAPSLTIGEALTCRELDLRMGETITQLFTIDAEYKKHFTEMYYDYVSQGRDKPYQDTMVDSRTPEYDIIETLVYKLAEGMYAYYNER